MTMNPLFSQFTLPSCDLEAGPIERMGIRTEMGIFFRFANGKGADVREPLRGKTYDEQVRGLITDRPRRWDHRLSSRLYHAHRQRPHLILCPAHIGDCRLAGGEDEQTQSSQIGDLLVERVTQGKGL